MKGIVLLLVLSLCVLVFVSDFWYDVDDGEDKVRVVRRGMVSVTVLGSLCFIQYCLSIKSVIIAYNLWI